MALTPFFSLVLVVLVLFSGITPSRAEETAMKAKQFPTSYFYQYQKIPISEKEKVLNKIDATLKKLNREGYGLIAKGAVLEKFGPETKTYDKLTILDESGLIIMVHRVPNLYYQYAGPGGINPNIYLIIKDARVNFPESYIRYGYVVEGDYAAYAHKFVDAIREGLERASGGVGRTPDPARR
ncbi:MAG: hypothetical protein ACOZFS_01065 [Thermodesulfobacteriota bacterium]